MKHFFTALIIKKVPLKALLLIVSVGVGLSLILPTVAKTLTYISGIQSVGEVVKTKKALASYQFNPTSSTLITGSETTITAATVASTEGTNVGSWKGTLADDGFHWVVAGAGASGLDAQLDVGGVELNGANKLMIQTEFDLDTTVLATEVQICDWISSTDVDDAADTECTGGGWRTLNTKNASQATVALSHTTAVSFQWHVYNGYWSTGTTGGTPINTPLTNFVNGSKTIKIRYYSATNSTSQIAIDHLRVYALIDPIYFPAEFVPETGGTATGHYGSTVVMGNTATIQQTATAGDAIYLQVPGTAGSVGEFYLKFKNIKTYTGMNTILVNTDAACSAATAGLQYRFKIRNFTTASWEDVSSTLDCSTTNFFNNFAKNNIAIDDYINGSDEIWVGAYFLSNSTTNLQIDSMYIMLGTTNTDTNSCEISFGSNIAGRIAMNPSAPGSDRIETMKVGGDYMYLAGYDSSGIDNEWRLEKRNTSDGDLVTAFDTDGVVTTDPSTGADQILAIASSSDAVFVGGYDSVAGAGQWRIEKRDATDGSLITAFDTDGIIQYNANTDMDQITSMTADADYLYVTGFEDDDSGVWRIHKYDITDGSLVGAFGTSGIITETLAAAGDERPQRIKVDADYLYISGWDNVPGNNQWRLEKRNKTTGALCAGGGECAAGAFDTDGVVQTNPSANTDRIYAMAVDATHIYVAGHDGVISAANGQWRIERRDIATGALDTGFDTDGIVQVDPNTVIDWVTDVVVDDTDMYLAGFIGSTAGSWRIEKRDKASGALDTGFSGDGIHRSEDGGDDRANAIAIDGGYLYVSGYGTAPGDNQWLVEKIDSGTGLRSTDSFGTNDCSGTRDIDITGGNRNAWAIQTEDESTNFVHPFYAFDNDGDAVVEEAGSANIGFSVTVPDNAAVTGIHWAGRAMSGVAGTVRFALKDYSGLTGTTGGRSLVGTSPTIAMAYNDPLVTAGVISGGAAGYMTNPEDYIDTVNNEMRLNYVTTVTTGGTAVNSVNIWDFAMVSFSWIEDAVHPSLRYQFNPTSSTLITGSETTITAATVASTEGTNVGSWKGTLADDGFHWVVAGAGASGLDAQLDVGGVELNGANKLMIQTEFDLDTTVLATEVQICDWISSTDVDDAADTECTGGGWRTLNTKNASQATVALSHTTAVSFQWHVYNGYWSTGTTGGTPINTPLTNFVNGSKTIKIRYYSATNSTSQIAIDHLRVYALIDPIYFPAEFVPETGGTATGHYGSTVVMGNTATIQQTATAGDAIYLQVPGTAGSVGEFYLKFKNIKTYTGMNTILVNTDAACSAATAGLQYRFKIRNFTTASWEDVSSTLDCSTTNFFNNFAKNNIAIDDYINGSDEIWVGAYFLSNSTTNLQIDSMYIMLGTTNTDTNSCEISFGSNIAGRIAMNPSAPGSDRIETMKVGGDYMYLAGYDSSGIDNEWRLEKRNTSDGDLVTAFDTDGVVTTDPSTGADQILAIASSSDAVFVGGYDSVAGAGQWRIEKRDATDGSLITAFDTDGIIQYNANTDMDQITSMTADADYLYVTGFEDDDSGVWRIHKYDITDGSLVGAFGTSGIITETLAAAGDERPQRIKVDADYLYISGWDNVPGNNQWRLEKRNKTTGALCAGGGECAAGAFDTDGVVQTNPSANTDRIYAMAVDATHIYVAGHDGVISAANGQWRIERRDIATGALDTGFDTDGIVQVDPNTVIDWVTDVVVDDTDMYLAGFIGSTAGSWRIEKRDKASGALDTGFSGDGIHRSEDGGDDRANAIAIDGGYLYVSGYGTAPGDNQWLVEKIDSGTGLRSTDSFGTNDCSGTRDIDITGGNRNAWAIQTEDESTNFVHPFYAFDNDGDAVVEEAGSANIGFSVTVPDNAAVTGIHWAGRAMSGVAGTVRFALKDYSGLTGTTGGRSLVGTSPTIAMAYNDPLVTAGVISGGAAGYMTNPEDYIDTVNNEMRLNYVTTVTTGGTAVNSVNIWDFAMVSFSWIETQEVPVYSISITSDGLIEYGYLDLSTATSTIGSDTQTAQNIAGFSERLNIRSSDATGGANWALSSSIGSNVYTHEFSTTTGVTWTSMPDSATYVLAYPLVTVGDFADFDFKITIPSDTTDFMEKSITVTVQAAAP
ncbi:MAG: hypothetical protein KBC35_00880 [Candidatus Pacebacteria bacterium]|nr:hypothetical protein [Candidatus Paceibacterota bacterium]